MIACQDLRTGNIVLVNNRLRKISMISSKQTLAGNSEVGVESTGNDESMSYPVEDILPVPLNEAILEQCHFTFHPYFKFWQLINDEKGRTEMDIDPDYNLIDFMRRPIIKNITSLHQLQNIYYTLFNKELDVDVDRTILVNGRVREAVATN